MNTTTDECKNYDNYVEPEPSPSEAPSFSTPIFSPKGDKNLTQYVSAIHGTLGILAKSIQVKLEGHLKEKDYRFSDTLVLILEVSDINSIKNRLARLGTLIWMDCSDIMCIGDSFLIRIEYSTRHTHISIISEIYTESVDELEVVKKKIELLFKDISKEVSSCDVLWYTTDSRGDVVSYHVPEILDDYIYHEAYPFIPNLDNFIENYRKSSESVLILMGPVGTGKTRLIRYMIRKLFPNSLEDLRNKPCVLYTTDNKVLEQDKMFIDFITSSRRLMVLEDVDFSLRDRVEGNTSMYRLLASSDGLLQANDKKIIFSTNVGHEREIDKALIRPGRCFDVIKFRNLSINEGQNFLNTFRNDGVNIKLKEENSLAELYRQCSSKKLRLIDKQGYEKVGFQT